MTKVYKYLVGAVVAFLFAGSVNLLLDTAPSSALVGTTTQDITIDVVAGTWENHQNVYVQKTETPLRYIVSNANGAVDEIYVGGELIPASSYSVIDVTPRMIWLAITLHPDYLETLDLGQHDFELVFANGETFDDVFLVAEATLIALAPSTGFLSRIGGVTGITGGIIGGVTGSYSAMMVVGGILIVGVVTFICIYRRKIRRSKSSPSGSVKSDQPLFIRRRGVVVSSIVVGITVVAIAGTSLFLHTPEEASAAPANPTISASPDPMHYRVLFGDETTLGFETDVTTTFFSASYVYSVVSNNTNPLISLSISGGNLASLTPVPATPSSPLAVYSYNSNASDGHTASFFLDVAADANTPFGVYTITLTHTVDTVEKPEHFKFTIDTRMTDTRDNDPTHYSGTATTFSIPTSGQVNGASDHPYGWIIDWGDGGAQQTVSGASSNNSDGISHTYPSPGEYQITISGLATDGWMDAFGFFLDTGAANTQANKNMFKSIDSPLTDLMRSSNASYRFAYMFFYAHNATGIPANLFSLVSTAGITDLSSMFRGTFSDFARNSTTATIPAGLFGSIDTSSATNLMGMFSNTFSFCAYNSVAGTIPAGLFGSIDTSSATNLTSMFSSTFSYYAFSSTVATVPAGLFGSIDTSRATNLSNMFSSTFNSYAFSSTTATIPAGLFGSIDTSSAINLTSMFRSTFDGYASNSTVGTIPAGLFSSVDTSRAINLTNMFSNTFHSYAASSTVGTIPAGLFDLVDASSATDLSGMFSGTFNGYARVNTTSTTDVNTIWGTVNFAGKVTAANAGGSSGVFYLTFYNVYTLTGAAQTFINTKLGGIIPSSKAYTFFGTRVTDLSSLNDNWK